MDFLLGSDFFFLLLFFSSFPVLGDVLWSWIPLSLAIELEMGSSCDKGICVFMYLYLAMYKNSCMYGICVFVQRFWIVCILSLVFILEKDTSASFMNICAYQISLRGFKMPKSYLSKVILPEWGEVDLFFYLQRYKCRITRAVTSFLLVAWFEQVMWSYKTELWPLSNCVQLWLKLSFRVSSF